MSETLNVRGMLCVVRCGKAEGIFDIRFFKVSFPIKLGARGQQRRSYETSQVDLSSSIKLAASLNPEH